MQAAWPYCRRCGGQPHIVADLEIVPGETSWAIHCSNPNCYNDTHWQNSLTAAAQIWHKNPCSHERGGQGCAADDEVQPRH